MHGLGLLWGLCNKVVSLMPWEDQKSLAGQSEELHERKEYSHGGSFLPLCFLQNLELCLIMPFSFPGSPVGDP